jgi:hypothetical protein
MRGRHAEGYAPTIQEPKYQIAVTSRPAMISSIAPVMTCLQRGGRRPWRGASFLRAGPDLGPWFLAENLPHRFGA